ncbi:MAG TPA: M1 family aminopeptidase [Actinopolymorphaceae bacterium]|nr:M1 family aminopeptidase [Actinopolymorphaceae bacterium]
MRGTESVRFTPDRRTCEVDFRAWPNKPETARTGNRLDVTAVAVRGRLVRPKVEAAGAPKGAPGTLVKVPVQGCLMPGRPVTVELAFTLTLGEDSSERVGFSSEDRTAWFATAYPLLAWERGHGWITDRAVDLLGETVTSEEFQLAELDVVAPKGDEVLGTGQARGTMPASRSGSIVHRFSAGAVRDVTVTVGQLQVVERTVGGVRVHVGVPASGSRRPVGEWVDATESAITRLSSYLGPFPYPDLWVTVEPDIPSGIELPGAIQFADVNPRTYPQLVPHEVAHMWFYGLVGNNQARDPWLDEAFAEYAEVLVNGTARAEMRFRVPAAVRNRVGESMAWYDGLHQPGLYGAGVYRQGSAMLHQARQAVGPATFDRLLRGYIDTNAHKIADDNDVGRAFASAPKAIAIFQAHGALPK